MDAHKNFAYSIVATGPSPAISGTSLVVQAGSGSKFPSPPFNATVWPLTQQPLDTNSEIVRVTNIVGDTLTITRAQESTTAQPIAANFQISAGITAKTLTDIETMLYPVGSVYINAAVATNPATLLGFGTWAAFGTGQVLVGVDTAQTEFNTLAKTGGEKTHTLIAAEIAKHAHPAFSSASSVVTDPGHHNVYSVAPTRTATIPSGTPAFGNAWCDGAINANTAEAFTNISVSTSVSTTISDQAAGDGAHNNLQPYITVYMWQRTA
jgi:microcystin-dependent protein